MAGDLTGKTALITGGARGQGRSHALHLARAGADVVLFDLAADMETVPYGMGTPADLAQTQALVEGLDRRCATAVVDVRDGGAMSREVQRVIAEFGDIDILLANAGILSWSSVEEMTDQMWREMIDVNLTGIFHSFRAVAAHMRERGSGRVVATASMAGRGGFANIAHYTAAKWGLIGLTKSFAVEMALHGVTANVVAPTNVDSDMLLNPAARRFFTGSDGDPTREDVAKALASMTAQGVPWVESADISNAILYLVSDGARHVTGEVLHVAAGMNAFNAV